MIVTNLFVKMPGEGEPSLPKWSVPEVEVYSGGCKGDFNFFRFNNYRNVCEKKGKQYDPENRAVLIMSLDVIARLNEEDWPVKPGDLGENLTIDGKYSFFEKGEIYRAGSAVLELTYPATPCKKLAQLPYVGEDKLAKFISTMTTRRGWYAKVVQEGVVKRGDDFILL